MVSGVEPGRPRLDETAQKRRHQLRFDAAIAPRLLEQFLELVKQDADIVFLRAAEMGSQQGRCIAAAVENAAYSRDGIAVIFMPVEAGQRLGQIGQRRVFRPHDAGPPLAAGPRLVMLKDRQHAGGNQRGLAAAQIAMHRDHALFRKAG